MKNEGLKGNLVMGQSEVPRPTFFPSISTIKTAMRPIDYVQFLNAMANINNQYLVSAYDLFHANDQDKAKLKKIITDALNAGMFILMDSGNYESYWKGEKNKWKSSHFHQVLKEFDASFVFSFDEQEPLENVEEHISLICKQYMIDQSFAGSKVVIPIIHRSPGSLPTVCRSVAEQIGAATIAIPERRLGEGIFERVKTLANIREALDSTGRYVGIHLLGTGNPFSIAIYSTVGADMFDGLEWCQTVVDHESGKLFHLSQADFFRMQTHWGEENLSFQMRTLAHNLVFYEDWIRRLRIFLEGGRGIEFCQRNFPQMVYAKLAEAIGWPKE